MTIFFHSKIMLRFADTKVTKQKFYGAKKTINMQDINVDNIVISKLVDTNTNSKYLIRYLNKVIRLLVFVLPKMRGYVKTFEVKNRHSNKNNKLMPFSIDDKKLLEKYKAIWSKTEDLSLSKIFH